MDGSVKELAINHSLDAESLYRLIDSCNDHTLTLLQQLAVETSVAQWGKGIFVRGLIEISSHCRNNCLYCGLRRDNTHLSRYRLSNDEILQCCKHGYAMGLRTFVLQSGEDPFLSDDNLCELVSLIRSSYPDTAITLSLGERSHESYQRLFEAGASRYLLRHEAAQSSLYAQIHPKEMSLNNRIDCIKSLINIGYQTGMGMMIGVPGQTTQSLVEDLMLMKQLKPHMIGIGPFITHHDTPLKEHNNGSLKLTLTILAITRLMFPDALIPATTALSTLSPDGHLQGILSGANVIMPNLSPQNVRALYNIYDNKAYKASQSADELQLLDNELHSIGYYINYSRGDHKNFSCNDNNL